MLTFLFPFLPTHCSVGTCSMPTFYCNKASRSKRLWWDTHLPPGEFFSPQTWRSVWHLIVTRCWWELICVPAHFCVGLQCNQMRRDFLIFLGRSLRLPSTLTYFDRSEETDVFTTVGGSDECRCVLNQSIQCFIKLTLIYPPVFFSCHICKKQKTNSFYYIDSPY